MLGLVIRILQVSSEGYLSTAVNAAYVEAEYFDAKVGSFGMISASVDCLR